MSLISALEIIEKNLYVEGKEYEDSYNYIDLDGDECKEFIKAIETVIDKLFKLWREKYGL